MSGKNLVFAVAVVAVAVGGGWLWRSGLLDESRLSTPVPVAQTTPEPAPAEPAPRPGPLYPLESLQEPERLAAGGLVRALTDLLGRQAMATFIQTDELPRRVVATIDNLGRPLAASRLWPVHPTAGRFTVRDTPQGIVTAPDNSARYAPFVQLVSRVDAATAAGLYRRAYPSLQTAYEELGFPGKYFNDRMVEVVDLLLATPEPEQPPTLRLTEVKGPVPSVRPWVRYEYTDPQLESLSSGQKILLRVGPDHRKVLKAKLAEFRKELVGPGAR